MLCGNERVRDSVLKGPHLRLTRTLCEVTPEADQLAQQPITRADLEEQCGKIKATRLVGGSPH